jgi:hypothetical protein
MSVTPIGRLKTLRRQMAATNARFAALAARLAEAAEAIGATGSLPSEALLRDIRDAAHDFETVRAAVLDAAASLEVLPRARPGDIVSLNDLAPVMDAVVRATNQAARRRQVDAARATAFAILNRVPSIVHHGQRAFAPLTACQDKARVLQLAIMSAVPVDLEPEVRAWARAVIPFAALLALIAGPQATDAAQWCELQETVASAFGRRLAAAAARGALTLA